MAEKKIRNNPFVFSVITEIPGAYKKKFKEVTEIITENPNPSWTKQRTFIDANSGKIRIIYS